MNPNKKVRVLVVDDSVIAQRMISDVLKHDSGIEVVGTAADAYVASDKIRALNPDVLTLDIQMPGMDGLTFMRALQQHRHMPAVVVVSSLTPAGSRIAIQAMELGAVDVLLKPNSSRDFESFCEQLPFRVKGAAQAQMAYFKRTTTDQDPVDVEGSTNFLPQQLMVMGASTGGTEALKRILTRLPDELPGICIVQHIPAMFSYAFAKRLNECCAFDVREAVHGDVLRPGLALVAPGDFHVTLAWKGTGYRVSLEQSPMVNHVRPSVDVLFESVACAGPNVLAVLLTGMGADGAQGMKKLKDAGAITIAQDEGTCVVYGMPAAAVELGVVDYLLPLELIPHAILDALQSSANAKLNRPAQKPSSTCLNVRLSEPTAARKNTTEKS